MYLDLSYYPILVQFVITSRPNHSFVSDRTYRDSKWTNYYDL